jgi:hypothetical protein
MTCSNIELLLTVGVFMFGGLTITLGAMAFILDERVRQQAQYIQRLEAEHWKQVKNAFSQ